MKVTYTEEAIADMVEAINYLIERSPTAAANLDAEIAQCIDRPLKQTQLMGLPCGDLLNPRPSR